MPCPPVQDGRLALDGRRLKHLRQRLGLSQEALAQHCFDRHLCVSIASIKRAERGRSVLYRTARHLASVFEVEVEHLAASRVDPAASHGAEPHPAAGPAAGPPLIDGVVEDDSDDPRQVLRLCLVAPEHENDTVARWDQQIALHGGIPLWVGDATSDDQAAASHRGDQRCAVFGLPQAYRSDALRCLHCALALQSLIGPATTLRIDACQYPLPEPTHAQASCVGNGATGIWLTRSVAVQLSEHIVSEDVGSGLLRYRGLRPEATARLPLSGRHAEVSQLKSLLDTTDRYQTGHLVYIRGVAGIGKTRLCQECADMAHQHGYGVQVVSVLDFGSRSNDGALAQLLRGLLSLPIDLTLDATSDPIGTALASLRLPLDHGVVLRPLLELAASESQQALYTAMGHDVRQQRLVEAFGDLIQRLAIQAPQLIVVEDLHWADDDLLTMLTRLLQITQEAPVIWLMTSRLEQDPLERRLRPALMDLPLSLIDLAPLRALDASALAEQFPDIPEQYALGCVQRAQGNPLFLTQLLMFHPGNSLPSSLHNLIQSKLDQLGTLERRAVRIAAAIGQRFPLTALRAVLGDPAYYPDLAVKLHLLRALPEQRFQFVHDLILQGIYEGMPAQQRTPMHLALADYYQASDTVLHAQHLNKARSLDAPAAFLLAIQQQLDRYRHAAALALIGQCRDIDYAPLNQGRLALMNAQACLATGLTQEAYGHFDDAARLARSDALRLDALLGQARTLNLLDDLTQEAVMLDRIADLAEPIGAHSALSEMHYLRGNLYFPRGDFGTSRHFHRQALEHARLGQDKRAEIQALSGLGDSYYAEGDMTRTREAFQHCVTLCRESEHRDLEAANLFMLATARIYANETPQALIDSQAAAELGQKAGNRRAEIVARLTASWILLSMNRSEDAQRHIDAAMALAQGMGSYRFEAFLLETQARLWLVDNQQDRARDTIRRSWQLVDEHHLHGFIGPWVLATLALLEPDPGQRRAALAQGEARMDEGCVGHNVYRFLITAAEVSLLDNNVDDARHFANRLAQFCLDKPCPWADHHVALIQGLCTWLDSQQPHHLDEAHALWQRGAEAGLAMTLPRLAERWVH